MRTGRWLAFVLVVAATAGSARGQGPPGRRVEGRVVDAEGKPASGIDVASFWGVADGKPRPYEAKTTDDDGRFAIEVPTYRPTHPLLAMDADRMRGGVVAVPTAGDGPARVEIRLAPTVRVRGKFTCSELGETPKWTNVYMNLKPGGLRILGNYMNLKPGGLRVLGNDSRQAEFDFRLPPGEYDFDGYGSTTDYLDVRRTLTLKADEPEVDLGTLDMKAAPLAKHYGQEPPPLTVTDARGVSKDVTLADYRGKWVILDFWGWWCGPCVGRSIPSLMDLHDEYEADRDKFVILTFHDPQAKDFDELDAKLEPIVRSTWHGRELPFPILLDTTGETVKRYGIRSWPTTLLIDPDGKLVRLTDAEAEDVLIAKLPPRPVAERVARALDKDVTLGLGQTPLDKALSYFGSMARIKIELDLPALKAAGVAPDAPIPLQVSALLTLRSWLDLVLEPFGLTYRVGDEGLIVTVAGPGTPAREESAKQEQARRRLEEMMARPSAFALKEATIQQACAVLEQATRETFTLDPVVMKAGGFDLLTRRDGDDGGAPLGEALRRWLEPLGLTYVIRDESVLVTTPERARD